MNLTIGKPDWGRVDRPEGIQAKAREISEIDDGKLIQLYEHWDGARGPRLWLDYAEFRPELCPLALPHLVVIECRPNRGRSLFIRLTGEETVNPNQGMAKGRFVEEMTPVWYREHMVSVCRQVLDAGAPLYQLVRMVHGYRVAFHRRLILPASRLGDKANVLLVASPRVRSLAEFMAAGWPFD